MSKPVPDRSVDHDLDFHGDEDGLGFGRILDIAQRQSRLILFIAAIFLALGAAYAISAPRLYTASARVLIDVAQKGVMQEVSPYGNVSLDSSAVESQVVVASSKRIVASVVDRAKLYDDPAILGESPGFTASAINILRSLFSVKKLFSSPAFSQAEQEERRSAAMDIVAANLTVARVPLTYALDISFTSKDPEKAALIANAMADSYILDQLDSRYEATRRAGTWLQERIAGLRNQTLEADKRVQDFKTSKGLVSSAGSLVNDQQLTQTSSQLVQARQATAEAAAKYRRIREIIDGGQIDAAVEESLLSSVISDLRERYLRAAKSERDLAAKLGPEHEQVIRLRTEMENYKQLIFEELRRISETYKSQLEIARQQESLLDRSVEELSSISNANNSVLSELRALQSEADTFRSMYQTFLQRYQEAVQGQSFPITEARVITRATTPKGASYPRKGRILMIAGLIGLVFGGAAAVLRELFDQGFRRADQVEMELGLPFLGMVPIIKLQEDGKSLRRGATGDGPASGEGGVLSYVNDHPLSAFAETIRTLRVSADAATPGTGCRILGFVSTYPNEGKSTLAKNFASSVAQSGSRTILIDGDLRKFSLSRDLAEGRPHGILEVLEKRVSLEQAVMEETASGLHFLPARVDDRITNSSQIMASSAMQSFVDRLRSNYDYVIFDLPPIGPVVDVRAAISLFDALVMVISWGDTPREGITNSLRSQSAVYDKCVGVVFNKVDQHRIHLYDRYGSYYYGRYSGYRRYSHYYDDRAAQAGAGTYPVPGSSPQDNWSGRFAGYRRKLVELLDGNIQGGSGRRRRKAPVRNKAPFGGDDRGV